MCACPRRSEFLFFSLLLFSSTPVANYDALFGLAVEEKVFELGKDEVEDGEEAPADLDDGRRDEPDV